MVTRIFSDVLSDRHPRIFSYEEKAATPKPRERAPDAFHRLHSTLVARTVCPIKQFTVFLDDTFVR